MRKYSYTLNHYGSNFCEIFIYFKYTVFIFNVASMLTCNFSTKSTTFLLYSYLSLPYYFPFLKAYLFYFLLLLLFLLLIAVKNKRVFYTFTSFLSYYIPHMLRCYSLLFSAPAFG